MNSLARSVGIAQRWTLLSQRPLAAQMAVRLFASYPPHKAVEMPALSPTMKTGRIAKWLVQEGAAVSPGEAICEVETDKSTLGFEVQDNAVIAKLCVPAGSEDIPIGKIIAVFVDDASHVGAFKDYVPADAGGAAPAAPAKEAPKAEAPKAAPAAPAAPTPAPAAPAAAAKPAASADGRVFASPYARKLASEKGVTLQQVNGSGPNGRIIAADVLEFQPKAQAVAQPQAQQAAAGAGVPAGRGAFSDIPVTPAHAITAEALTQSKRVVPHYYLTVDLTLDDLIAVKDKMNAALPDGAKLSVNDFLYKAAVVALRNKPEVNSSWFGTIVRQYDYVDLNVSIAGPKGSVSPVIRNADRLGLRAIHAAVAGAAAKVKDGKLSDEDLQVGTFTISDVSAFGVRQSAGIVVQPQAAVLSLGAQRAAIVPNAAAGAEKPWKKTTVMSVTLSCDHRVVDGAVGAQWLAEFKQLVENPTNMLL